MLRTISSDRVARERVSDPFSPHRQRVSSLLGRPMADRPGRFFNRLGRFPAKEESDFGDPDCVGEDAARKNKAFHPRHGGYL
jgi:hypothetical protein